MKKPIFRDDADLIGSTDIPAEISTDELATLLGVTRRNIDMLTTKGILDRIGLATFDTRAAISAYAAYARRSKSPDLDAEKLRLTSEQADKIELANAAARGDLVSADAVESRWAGILRGVRSAMLAVPSRVAGRAGHFTGSDIDLIDREVRDALQEISNGNA